MGGSELLFCYLLSYGQPLLRSVCGKGVSVPRTETDPAVPLAGEAGQQRMNPLLMQQRVFRVAASTAALSLRAKRDVR